MQLEYSSCLLLAQRYSDDETVKRMQYGTILGGQNNQDETTMGTQIQDADLLHMGSDLTGRLPQESVSCFMLRTRSLSETVSQQVPMHTKVHGGSCIISLLCYLVQVFFGAKKAFFFRMRILSALSSKSLLLCSDLSPSARLYHLNRASTHDWKLWTPMQSIGKTPRGCGVCRGSIPPWFSNDALL